MRETWFEAFLMDLGLGPGKRGGIGVVGLDEGIDMLPELFDRGEGSAVQRLSFQDLEPDFHLIEPGGPRRREVEKNVRVALEPAIVPGLDPRPLPQPVLRFRRTRQALKLGTFLRRQNDNRRLRDAAHASLNHDSCISDSWY